jgi:twitching motility protein PilT
VVFLGEIRDHETALAAIQAAQTGHLVLSTLHTIDATETISRVVELFPPQQQPQARVSLAGALRGVVSQRLLERADGLGRVPPVEVLLNTGRVYERILDAEQTSGLPEVIAESGYDGMQTFDQSLIAARPKRGRLRAGRARRCHEPPRFRPGARCGRDRSRPGARRAGRSRSRP